MATIKLDTSDLNTLRKLRHHLHRHPEQSHKESETAQHLLEWAKEYLPTFKAHTGLGGNGLLLTYDTGNSGPNIVFRAELDALPITEENNDLGYASVHNGTAHKCGHDGHMTIVCGLGMLVEKHPPKNGAIGLLFQPAEETGEGAALVLKSEAFQNFKADASFALHNLPGKPLGTVLVKTGSMCMASTGLWLRIKGKTSHAAEPFAGKSPLPLLADLLPHVQFEKTQTSPHRISTLIHTKLGEAAFGTTPGKLELALTLRAETDETLEYMISDITDKAKTSARKHGLSIETERVEPFAAVINREEDADYIIQAAKKRGQELEIMQEPTRWSEDMGELMKVTTGALFCLGSGENCPVLHHPTYDFPDELIPIGSELFYHILVKKLSPS